MYHLSGSSHSDKEVDALTPEKSAAMRGSVAAPGTALVPPSGATPTIAIPDRKRRRKGNHFYLLFIVLNATSKYYANCCIKIWCGGFTHYKCLCLLHIWMCHHNVC